MPHVSKKKLTQQQKRKLDTYITSLLRDTGSLMRTNIFKELLTETEKIMIAKRVAMLFLIEEGFSVYKIHTELGVSPSTVERFRLAVEKGKFERTSKWIQKQRKEGSIESLLETIAALAFTGKTRSFKKFVDEI